MTGRIARWMLALYPLGFQRRYGDEMRALLEQRRPSPRTVLDLLLGALRAHISPPASTAGAVTPGDRIRLTGAGVLACWVLFAAAGAAFYKTTEDYPFSAAGHAHALLRDAHLAVQIAAVIGSAAVVLGALPLMAIAFDRARSEPVVRRYVVMALAPVLGFAGLTAVLVAIAHSVSSPNPSTGAGVVAVVWSLGGLGCGLTCALACRGALFAIPVRDRWLRSTLAAGGVVTIAMAAVAVATGIYAIALMISVPSLASSLNGPFQVADTGGSLLIQTVAMAALSALAMVTMRRGWAAGKLGGSPTLTSGESGT
jgi:hypothetical protein